MNSNKFYYPPGGILIWLIIILEIFTFLGASFIFLYYRGISMNEFVEFRSQISPTIGTINTLLLITSGLFVANSVHQIQMGKNRESAHQILLGLLFGLGFLFVKGFEYYQKINAGIGLDENTFFTLYWLMTGFHFVHVLFGVGLLFYMYYAVKNNTYDSKNYSDVESSATYWHMCDLIWILIFPILYLI